MWSLSSRCAAHVLRRQNRAVPTTMFHPARGHLVRWSSSAAPQDDEDEDRDEPAVMPTKNMNAFGVLNVERKFDIPQSELKQSYRKLMAQLHPDKHHGKPAEEQEKLAQQATQVTQSYQILKQSTTRATHMLQLLGKVEDHLDEAEMRELMGPASNMLLMEIMEIREAVDEAGSDQEQLKHLMQENQTRMDDVCDQLATAFQAEDLDRAVELTVQLQYYGKIDTTIRQNLEHE